MAYKLAFIQSARNTHSILSDPVLFGVVSKPRPEPVEGGAVFATERMFLSSILSLSKEVRLNRRIRANPHLYKSSTSAHPPDRRHRNRSNVLAATASERGIFEQNGRSVTMFSNTWGCRSIRSVQIPDRTYCVFSLPTEYAIADVPKSGENLETLTGCQILWD